MDETTTTPEDETNLLAQWIGKLEEHYLNRIIALEKDMIQHEKDIVILQRRIMELIK